MQKTRRMLLMESDQHGPINFGNPDEFTIRNLAELIIQKIDPKLELLFEPFTPMTKVFLERKIEEVLINYEPRVEVQNIAVDDDQDRNRLVVDIYFYVVGVPGPQVVQTFLQRVR